MTAHPIVLLGTRSAGKLRELATLLDELGVTFTDPRKLGMEELPEEDSLEPFDSFEENALAKASYFFRRSGGLPTIADDSGLLVDALDGKPGVITKRWSGRSDLEGSALDAANNEKLVQEMARVEGDRGAASRRARYVSVAAYVDAGTQMVRRGEIEGEITREPRGTLGFGYDPYFFAPELSGTFAESALENTARHSHRSRAVRALVGALRDSGRLR